MDRVTVSQRKENNVSFGGTSYLVCVASRGQEIQHEYCLYHPQAGPVRPDPVTSLRLEDGILRWDWSENSYDLASPGASFERPVNIRCGDGDAKVTLEWGGSVVRTPKVRPEAAVPDHLPPAEAELSPGDVEVTSEWTSGCGGDEVKVIVAHPKSASRLEWEGTSTAENQSIRDLRAREAGDKPGYVFIEFVYSVSENGLKSASNMALLARLEGGSLRWVDEK